MYTVYAVELITSMHGKVCRLCRVKQLLYSCNGFSAIRYFSLLFKIGNGNVTIQGFIKQYFPILFKTDDGIKTIQGFSFTYILSYIHT